MATMATMVTMVTVITMVGWPNIQKVVVTQGDLAFPIPFTKLCKKSFQNTHFDSWKVQRKMSAIWTFL